MFIKLNFPEFEFKTKNDEANNILIYDKFRKKWILCNSEEWVRQNLLKYLNEKLNYPLNLIAVEKSISIANRRLRFDALVYSPDFNPLVIIECKSPKIKITQDSFDQIFTYNYLTKAPYLLVTNGLFHVFCKIEKNNTFSFCEEILEYRKLTSD